MNKSARVSVKDTQTSDYKFKTFLRSEKKRIFLPALKDFIDPDASWDFGRRYE